MYYINSTPNTSGNYGNPMGQPFSGCLNLLTNFSLPTLRREAL